MDIGQQAPQDSNPLEKEDKWDKAIITLDFFLEPFSGVQHRKGEPKEGTTVSMN